MKRLGVRPGIWMRPTALTIVDNPARLRAGPVHDDEKPLDLTRPENLQGIGDDTARVDVNARPFVSPSTIRSLRAIRIAHPPPRSPRAHRIGSISIWSPAVARRCSSPRTLGRSPQPRRRRFVQRCSLRSPAAHAAGANRSIGCTPPRRAGGALAVTPWSFRGRTPRARIRCGRE